MHATISRRGLVAGACLGLTASPVWAADTEFTLRLSSWGAPSVPQVSVYVPEFTKRVQEGSQGRIAVQHYPAGSLVKETDVATAIQGHVVDISLSEIGTWRRRCRRRRC